MKASTEEIVVDVLILHGKSRPTVNYLQKFFAALGLHATTVLDLPSLEKPQEAKVNHYIKQCLMPLVLATFDEDEQNPTKARPNVYDEIARCRNLKRNDTVVLLERKGGRLVELPSNVAGQMVMIEFESNRRGEMVLRLLTELRVRQLRSKTHRATVTNGTVRTLRDFLDKMDFLWEEEITVAWNSLHRLDYKAERELALVLDKFFEEYASVFSAHVREGKTGSDLESVCDAAYSRSVAFAVRAWEHAADAKMQLADQRPREGAASAREKLYDRAGQQLRKGKISGSGNDREKIKYFKTAIQLADQYLSR